MSERDKINAEDYERARDKFINFLKRNKDVRIFLRDLYRLDDTIFDSNPCIMAYKCGRKDVITDLLKAENNESRRKYNFPIDSLDNYGICGNSDEGNNDYNY